MILRQHHLLRAPFVTPSRTNSSANIVSGTSTVITPTNPVTEGRVMFILVGGRESRTITPPSGWTLESRALSTFGTIGVMWKVATGSEPSSYTVNYNASLNGGYNFFEVIDGNPDDPVGTRLGIDNGAGDTTLVLPSFNITRNELFISILAKDSTSAWTANSPWATGNISGQMKIALRTYQKVEVNQVLTWSGTSEQGAVELFSIRPRIVH